MVFSISSFILLLQYQQATDNLQIDLNRSAKNIWNLDHQNLLSWSHMIKDLIILLMSVPKQIVLNHRYRQENLVNMPDISPVKSRIAKSATGRPENFINNGGRQPQKFCYNEKEALTNERVYQVNMPEPQSFDCGLLQYHKDVQKGDHQSIANPRETNRQANKMLHQARYSQSPYYHDPKNWRLNPKNSDLILLNQQWKNNTSKILGFVIKKFLTSGNFMGICFPTFAMKPESILETYAKSFGVAPKLFCGGDRLQRMKQYITFIFTVSYLQIDINKPFNPVLGETFQAIIGDGQYSAQQISHHPPVSAFLYVCQGYKIYGQLQLSASIGFNSGQGRFLGQLTVQFADGHWIKGRIPNGVLTGFVMGDTLFQTYGGAYAYDRYGMVSTFQLGDKYIFRGFIGTFNGEGQNKFRKILKKNDRFIKFSAFSKNQFAKIYAVMSAKAGLWVAFDGGQYFNFLDKRNLPILPQPIDPKQLLKSDSSLRMDIQLRKNLNINQSQYQKQLIQNQQRRLLKLRQKYHFK